MSFNPVFNPTPKTKVLTAEEKQFIYYLVEATEEIYVIVNIESNLEQNKVRFEILEYNKKYLQEENTCFFLKTLFYNILDLSFNNITIVNFPMDNKTWEKYFKKLDDFVDNRIKINKGPKFGAGILNYINFTIKRTKKNHYIPQGYLKSFSCTPLKKSRNKRIFVYDKEKGGLLERNGSNTIKIENITEQLDTQGIIEQLIIKSYLYLFLSEDNSEFIKEVIDKHPESLKKDGNRIKIEKLK